MLHVAFVGTGTFPANLEQPVRRHLTVPCEIIVASEADILPRLPEIDVLVTMGLTAEMGRAATRLKLVQVPGAGVDRVDRTAVPAGAVLANAYGHEVGIAEYVIGAMLALTREFSRLDAALRQGDWQSHWAVGTAPPPLWPELAGRTVGILGYGRIGQNIARRARAFEMQVCRHRRRPADRSDRSGVDLLQMQLQQEAVMPGHATAQGCFQFVWCGFDPPMSHSRQNSGLGFAGDQRFDHPAAGQTDARAGAQDRRKRCHLARRSAGARPDPEQFRAGRCRRSPSRA
jgi:hypothetical protein